MNSQFLTPDFIISELQRLMAESQRGIQALYEAEIKMINLDADYDHAVSTATLSAEGTALERQSRAKLSAADKKFQVDLARAEYNRIKLKLRAIESAQVSMSVIGKQIELQWKSA